MNSPPTVDRPARISLLSSWVGWSILAVGLALPAAYLAWRDLPSASLWFDESGQFWLALGLHHFSQPLTPPGEWAQIVEFGRVFNSDPGGFTLLLRCWIDLFGPSPAALRSLPFLFFVLSGALLVCCARRAGTPWPWAALAGILPAGFPMFVHYSTEIRAYSMETAAVVWLFFSCVWLKETSGPWRWFIVGCVGALLASSRYSAFLFALAAGPIAFFPLRPLRTSLIRGFLHGLPFLVLAIAAYWFFARMQAGGSHRPPAYVEPFILAGQTIDAAKALLVKNFLTLPALPITVFLGVAPLFLAFTPKRLVDLRPLVARTFLFVAGSVVLTIAASALGKLPWAVDTRWSIGYHALAMCCLAMGPIILGIWLSRLPKAASMPWAFAILALAPAALWAVPVSRTLGTPRIRYETIAAHLTSAAAMPSAHSLRFFIANGATPTVRYLVEAGPLADAFDYPASFHFETGVEAGDRSPINASDFDVIVLTHFSLADGYRDRVTGSSVEQHDNPGPSCLFFLRQAP